MVATSDVTVFPDSIRRRPMVAWLKQYASTHIFYIILIVGGVAGFRFWLSEHDRAVQLEQTIKANNQIIAGLNDQIKTRDEANVMADKKVQVIVTAAKTPTAVVAAIPQIAPQIAAELNARTVPNLPNVVQVDAPGLMDLTGKFVTMSQDLATCQADYADEQKKFDADESSIKALKTKPKFFKRVGHDLKIVAITAGVTAILIVAHGGKL